MGPKTKPAEPTRHGPHPDDAADVRASLEEADRGETVEITLEELDRLAETGEWPERFG